MPALESLVSFVNSWECDENAHLNVQFYFARFETADAHFRTLVGLPASLRPGARHVRYHAELAEGDLVRAESCVVTEGPLAPGVVHTLLELSTGKVIATAWDAYHASAAESLRGVAQTADAAADVDPRLCGPRGVTAPVPGAISREHLLASGGFVSTRGIIHPADTDADGCAQQRALVGYFSDGASVVWERSGVTKELINSLGYGRVAVEMRLTRFDRFRAGDLVEQISGLVQINERTLWFRHHQFEARTGRLVTIGDAVGLAMDLTTRKAVRFPADAIAGAPILGERAG
ncbi:thioesterase family protein [Amorphus orientalis]|uniref:Acyl-CoA thioester hydrolase n=1 Tax=Amorphus orientalis TaxID=649198 RepID=A0AAE4ASI8_9HYPH|nr:thioesterase family protein [Amorphus orientalis]MDQ0315298.1 acyl-CoA thioester hydrolase [Amorphus orientalis]